MGEPDTTAAYVNDLAERLESAWCAVNRDEERFPAIALEELARTPPHQHIDIEEVVTSFLSHRQPATRQLAPVGAFGQPGITLHYGPGFVIDIYFWNNCVPAIHNHPFTGVFTILRGFSLNSTYRFTARRRLGARVQIGDLVHEGVAILREGDSAAFSLVDHPLIHSLIHVPNPSVSLVVRTVRTLEYFRYFPPSVALAMNEPDEPTCRQLRLIEFLRAASDANYMDHARQFLDTADFETTFRAISSAWGHESCGELLAFAKDRHHELADLISPAVHEATRLQQDNLLREQFASDDDRMIASILMSAANRQQVHDLLAEWFREMNPQQVLAGWVNSCGLFEDDPAAASSLREIIQAGGTEIAPEATAFWEETIFRALLR